MSLKLKSVVEGAIVPLLALVVWEACARAGLMSAVVLPAPSAVAAKWWASLLPMQPHDPAQMGYLAWLFSGEMIHDAISSMYRVVVGFLEELGMDAASIEKVAFRNYARVLREALKA